MRTDRLEKLADYLENHVKDEWFDITRFASPGFAEKKCGTVGCAIGFYCTQFPEEGLRIAKIPGSTFITVCEVGEVPDYRASAISCVSRHFDITREQTKELFYNILARKTRFDVAAGIRELIRGA